MVNNNLLLCCLALSSPHAVPPVAVAPWVVGVESPPGLVVLVLSVTCAALPASVGRACGGINVAFNGGEIANSAGKTKLTCKIGFGILHFTYIILSHDFCCFQCKYTHYVFSCIKRVLYHQPHNQMYILTQLFTKVIHRFKCLQFIVEHVSFDKRMLICACDSFSFIKINRNYFSLRIMKSWHLLWCTALKPTLNNLNTRI